MKKVIKIRASGFYIFESRATGNSNYIESIIEAKRLLTYMNYFLKRYLKIHDYVISRHGFQLLVKINNEKAIRKLVSQNSNKDFTTDIWRIISERIRLAISAYVRFSNNYRKRKGTLVEREYNRYYFETKEEAVQSMEKMRNQNMKSFQRKKYRGKKSHYRICSKIAQGSIYLCSYELSNNHSRVRNILDPTVFSRIDDLVVQNIVNNTIVFHKPLIPPLAHINHLSP